MILKYSRKDAKPATFQVRADTSDHKAIEEVYKKNSYQRKSFTIGSHEKWLDLGANIGAFSVYAASKNNKVISYEAETTNANLTALNIISNGYDAEVYQKAVMADDYAADTVDLYVSSRPMALRRHSVFPHKKDFQKITVPVIRFSDLLRLHKDYRCVKMNIEGTEIAILGAKPDLSQIDKLVLEWSFDKDKRIQTLLDTLAYLKSQFVYVDINKKIPNTGTWDFYPPNAFIYAMKSIVS